VMERMQRMHVEHKDHGLNVIGLTQLSRSATEEGLLEYIDYNNLTFPIAREDGSASDALNGGGVPAVAVVRDGSVLWKSHPNQLTDAVIAGLVED